MSDQRVNVNQRVQQIARVCHEANRVIQISLGEEVNPSWDRISDDLFNSTCIGVLNAMDEITPEQSHENWMAERRANGWTFGYPLDRVKKIHPCLVPYEDLPENQKLKDELFLSIVTSMKNNFEHQ